MAKKELSEKDIEKIKKMKQIDFTNPQIAKAFETTTYIVKKILEENDNIEDQEENNDFSVDLNNPDIENLDLSEMELPKPPNLKFEDKLQGELNKEDKLLELDLEEDLLVSHLKILCKDFNISIRDLFENIKDNYAHLSKISDNPIGMYDFFVKFFHYIKANKFQHQQTFEVLEEVLEDGIELIGIKNQILHGNERIENLAEEIIKGQSIIKQYNQELKDLSGQLESIQIQNEKSIELRSKLMEQTDYIRTVTQQKYLINLDEVVKEKSLVLADIQENILKLGEIQSIEQVKQIVKNSIEKGNSNQQNKNLYS